MMFYGWRPYVSVAQRRAQASREMEKLRKKGHPVAPVVIQGRSITTTFWGHAWCENLERYSDYENRLPRGRTYVRNGSVVDLQITPGKIQAIVSGSELYRVTIQIQPLKDKTWKAIQKDCAGSIHSLVELLQGRFSKAVMERICRKGDGLFPTPHEIELDCSCPDWAVLCKHVAAVLYGVGARLDHEPELLFVLRGVDGKDLIAQAATDLSLGQVAANRKKILESEDLGDLFGLDLEENGGVASEDVHPVNASPKPQSKESRTPSKVQRITNSNYPSREADPSSAPKNIQRPAKPSRKPTIASREPIQTPKKPTVKKSRVPESKPSKPTETLPTVIKETPKSLLAIPILPLLPSRKPKG